MTAMNHLLVADYMAMGWIDELVRALIVAYVAATLTLVLAFVPPARTVTRWVSIASGVTTALVMSPYVVDLLQDIRAGYDRLNASVALAVAVAPTVLSALAGWMSWHRRVATARSDR